MISLPMTPYQFSKVEEFIKEDNKDATLETTGENVGHIHTSQIDADYEYKPGDNDQGTLVFTNEVKHGFYKAVSDDTIGAHLVKLLGNIPLSDPTETPAVPEAAATSNTELEAGATAQNNFVKPTIQA